MKLLSDFDGVWTDPGHEARAQGDVLDETLRSWAPAGATNAWAEWLVTARAKVGREPRRYGWAPGGHRLSVFADEDPFAAHSALLHYLFVSAGEGRDATASAILETIRARGFTDLDAFGAHTHASGVARVAGERGPEILPSAAAAGRRMLEQGIEIVVVSNSTAEKLVKWFAHAELPYTVHPERASGALRLRGGAKKFILDPERSEMLDVGEARIDVARPHYAEVLDAERPGAVVGDVVSLDLGLPLLWKRRRPEWRGVRLFWLLRPYTPSWLADQVRSAARGEIEPIGDGLDGVESSLGRPRR
ncbi:MAG TPA: hypothetical protein VEY91_06825 [Candidatus Limnocylindria bacterium]|nr:hypothetical protein [Candidatus Limnocylindria bacterium]